MSLGTHGETPMSRESEHDNMLMSTLVSSLSKLAARLPLNMSPSLFTLTKRWPPLISRVTVCLEKLKRYRTSFHPSVLARAQYTIFSCNSYNSYVYLHRHHNLVAHHSRECLRILAYPSVAAAILDSPHLTSPPTTTIDADSSLPLVLRTPSQSLEMFSMLPST